MESNELNLEEIIALGGTKEDYDMLKDLEKNKTSLSSKKDTFKESEFEDLVKELGFKHIKKKGKSLKETKKNKNKESTKQKKKRKTKEPVQDNAVSSSSDDKKITEKPTLAKPDKITIPLPQKVLYKAAGPWHEQNEDQLQTSDDSGEFDGSELKLYAEQLLKNELSLYQEKKSGSTKGQATGNAVWMKTVATAGTLSDRVSALSLMVQEDQLHNFHCLEQLVAMMKKKGRREAIMGLEAIRDQMLGDLLPNNRRLKFFHQQPLSTIAQALTEQEKNWSIEPCQRKLLLWIFEDHLKSLFKSFLDHLNVMAHDALEASKTKAMSVALNLLLHKPEQEKALLMLLVNKLGDPKYKIASKALHMLNLVVSNHPLMQGIVVREVRDLLLRPNLAARAQYYCVCFLSSQILSHERKDVAKKLIQIYMNFFKSCIKKKSTNNKMLSALLTGVNRAFPYADLADQDIINELDVLFRTVHIAGLSTMVQALVLLFQVFSSRNEVSDRYYNALYSSLFHPELTVSTHRHPMYLNLLYRSLKADPCEPRVQAFIKRMLQVCALHQSPFTAAVLVLIHELASSKPSLAFCFFGKTSSQENNTKGEELDAKDEGNSDDEDEHFEDIKLDSDVEESQVRPNQPSHFFSKTTDDKVGVASSWTHKHKEQIRFGEGVYNPLHRNPQFAAAEKSCLWELHRFVRHFHPTVSLFSKDLLEQKGNAEHTGDPLDDYTLIKFLDRFVYRNPKSKEGKRTKSGEPVKMLSIHRRKRHAAFNSVVPVNSAEFLQKQKLCPEEVFFHKYFTSQAGIRPRNYKSPKTQGDEEIESVSDDEFESFMRSSEGQKQLDHQLNFSDHVYKNSAGSKRTSDDAGLDSNESDLDDGLDDDEIDMGDGYGFEMEEDEDDLLEKAGTFDFEKDMSRKPRQVDERKSMKKELADVDEFSMMLEEHTHNKFDSISSSAVSNKDRASVKQLKWERQQEMKDAVARKRRKVGDKGTHGGKRQKSISKRRGKSKR